MAQQGNNPVPFAGAVVAGSTGNRNGQIFPSASRTAAAYTSESIANPGAKGVRLFIVNDGAGGSTATVKIQVQDPNTAAWVDLTGAVTTALGAVSGFLVVYPGITGGANLANVAINDHLGPVWRVVLTIGTATGVSSVGAVYLT